MNTAGTSYIEIRAKLDQFERDLRNAEDAALKGGARIGSSVDSGVKSKLRGLSDFGKRVGKSLAVGAGVGLAALAVAGKSALDAAQEAAEVGAQTDAVLKSTGNAANVTADDIDKLATRISLYSAIEDEAVASGANMLLTFTNIRNEVGAGNDIFDQATERLADMSVAMGTDMKSAAIQVGKALNDPVKGVTALGRAGVQFSEKQKKTIERMVATNRTMDAQKIILGELETQFGGTARKVGNTKSWDKMKNAIGEVMESIGTALLPTINDLADRLAKFVQSDEFQDWMKQAEKWLKERLPDAIAKVGNFIRNDLKPAFDTVRSALGPIVGLLSKAIGFLERIRAWSPANLNPFSGIDAFGAVSGLFGGDSGGGAGAGKFGTNLVSIGRTLQSQGFLVGEHPAFGGVDPVHTAGSYHYIGRAIDINWPGPNEAAVLTGLGMKFQQTLPGIAELLGPWNDPNHQSHLHLAMFRGGVINEPVFGRGLRSGRSYSFGERGPETVTPGVGGMTVNIYGDVYDYDSFERKVNGVINQRGHQTARVHRTRANR